MHGFYLTINHTWRQVGPRLWPDRESYNRFMKPAGLLITFVSVAASMIVFRAATMGAAANLLKGMIGLNGLALPRSVIDRLGPVTGVLSDLGVVRGLEPGVDVNQLTIWIAALTFIALVFPNTLEVLARYEPALGVKELPPEKRRGRLAIAWSASPKWAILISIIAATGVVYLGGQSEFLYWQF
jgi:hypothetical protein